MGIRFHCPNGHKLNVKSFLAGKKGVCPKCGTRMRIPTASEPGLDDGSDSDVGQDSPQAGNGSAALAAARPAAVPLGAVVTAGGMGTAATPAAVAAVPTGVPVAAPAGVALSDPIAEAPAAVWYVRPPSGGQYGPARGDILRRWIAEGRVSSDSLVWREGWTDWRSAGQLFRGLNSATSPAAAAPIVAPGAASSLPTPGRSARTTSRYRTKKSSGSGLAIAALVVLGILCVALVAVLVYVLANLQ